MFDVDVDERPVKEVLILLAMVFVVRCAVYVALKHKTTFKGKKVKSD